MTKTSCVILAGGKGERLYPITQTRPKPLCPVGNATCLGRCIVAAKSAGIKDITITACYLAETIEKEAANYENIKVRRESTMLGTAGSVRNCSPSGGSVLVLSGDGVNDFDLKSLLTFHEKSGCVCTITVIRSAYPTDYGVVTVKDGVISRFYEKPGWEKVTSDTINAGIYVLSKEALSYIPADGFFDFSNDLFPLLMKKGYRIAAWEASGYWCDIGNPKALYDCSMKYTGGRSSVNPTAIIGEAVSINSSIIMENAIIGERTVVDSSIICENVRIGNNVLVPKGCVIGGGTVISDGAVLSEGITVASGVLIGKGGKIVKDVRFGGVKGRLFDGDEGINGIYGQTFEPSDGVSLGRALCEAAGKYTDREIKIGVMYSPNPHSRLLAESIAGGIRYGGGIHYDFDEGFSSLCGFCAKEFGLDFSVFVEVRGDFSVNIQVYDSSWNPVRGKVVNSIETSFYRGSKTIFSPLMPYIPGEFEKPLYLYANSLLAQTKSLEGVKLAVDTSNLPGNVLFSVVSKLGADVTENTNERPSLRVSDDGREIYGVTEKENKLGFWQFLCFYLGDEAEHKRIVYVPEETPVTLCGYVASKGCDCKRCTEKADTGRDFDPCFRDGCFLGLNVLGILKHKKIGFEDMAGIIPEFHIRTITGEYEESGKASKTRKLCEECGCEDGARFSFEKGSVRLIPSSPKGFRIISEAASSEYAEELCDFGLKKLKD